MSLATASRLLLLGLGLVVALAAVAAPSQKDDSDRRLKALVSEIKTLQENLQRADDEKKDLGSQLRQIETDSAGTRKQIYQIQQDVERLDKELAELDGRRRQLEDSAREQQQHIKRDIASAYRLGRQPQLVMLLNQEDPQRFNRALKYHDYFFKARTERLQQFQQTLTELDQVGMAIVENRTALDQQREALGRQQQNLQREKDLRQQTLASLDQQISQDRQQLTKLRQERATLEKLLAKVEMAVGNIPIPGNYQPLEKLRGKLAWPVDGQVSQRFGGRRSGDMLWQGLLLRAKEGTPVWAVHHGRVVFSDYLRGQGLLLILDHGNGYLSLYAHNQMLLRETGDWVAAGEAIARVGNTGGLDQSALYFEIRHNGKPTNPAIWLASAK